MPDRIGEVGAASRHQIVFGLPGFPATGFLCLARVLNSAFPSPILLAALRDNR